MAAHELNRTDEVQDHTGDHFHGFLFEGPVKIHLPTSASPDGYSFQSPSS